MKDKKGGKRAGRDGGNIDIVRTPANPNPYSMDMRLPAQGKTGDKGRTNNARQLTKDQRKEKRLTQSGFADLRQTAYDNLEEASELHEPVADYYRSRPDHRHNHNSKNQRQKYETRRKVNAYELYRENSIFY